MRHIILTAPLLTAFLLSACAPDSNTDTQSANAPNPIAASAEPIPKTLPDLKDKTPAGHETTAPATEKSTLPKKYQDLDPSEISRAEIDELIILKAEVRKGAKTFRQAMSAWRKQDASRRGPRPVKSPVSLSPEDQARLKALEAKLENAIIRKKYDNFDLNILSAAEVQEIILLEQEQAKVLSAHQDKMAAWGREDPATRGPQPKMDSFVLWGASPRLMELQGKIESAEDMKRLALRVENLSDRHNVSFSEGQMIELAQLEREARTFQVEFAKAMAAAENENQLTGIELSEDDVFQKIPKQLFQNMMDVERRRNAIKGPLEAAEKADKIQTRLTKLSEESGVPILSGEIAETIALSAEKDAIRRRTEQDMLQKWLVEGGTVPTAQPLGNDEDYARLKEIDARLKTISAPMTDAKNAALEADNPARRQQRLDRESRKKWQEDWLDKQQAGDVPLGSPLSSPSYAELQDRTDDYASKLKTRAEAVGYSVPEPDVERLDALNKDMLAIRKTVYDMEKNGSSHVKGKYGRKTRTSGTAVSMYKIQMIEQKQQEILAGLSDAESFRNGAAQSNSNQTGSRQYGLNDLSQSKRITGLEAMIKMSQASGLALSQSDIDDLRAFEQELNGP